MAGPIIIEVVPHPREVAVVRLVGPLDRISAPDICPQLLTAIKTGPATLILDVHHVPTADGAGVQTLAFVMHRARQAGGDLRIAGPTEQVKQRLAVAGLDQIIPTHDTLVDALATVS